MATRANVQTDIHADISAVGTVGTTSGLSVTETGCGPFRQTVIDLDSVAVTIADTGGANGGFVALLLYTMPEGVIQFHGAHLDFADGSTVPTGTAFGVSVSGSGGVGATAAFKFSLGTAAEATNDTLDSTQANLIASTSITLAASAGTGRGTGLAPPAAFDGTATAVKVYLNIGVANADISANDTGTLKGRLVLNWSHLGD